jgi:hypothetical protein
MLSDTDRGCIRRHFTVPPHIEACSRAICYDLLFGPSWSLIPSNDITKYNADCLATFRADLEDDFEEGDVIEETYVGQVAQALRDFIDSLPSEIYYDKQLGEVLDKEPEGYEDEDGEYYEPDWDDYYKLDSADIVEVLFGKTIAREFK